MAILDIDECDGCGAYGVLVAVEDVVDAALEDAGVYGALDDIGAEHSDDMLCGQCAYDYREELDEELAEILEDFDG